MNNVPVPLFVCDPTGRLTRYNDSFIHSPLLTALPEEGTPFPACLWASLPNSLRCRIASRCSMPRRR